MKTQKLNPEVQFIGYQEYPGGKIALYNINKPGHPRNNSTVSAETLKELKIPVWIKK